MTRASSLACLSFCAAGNTPRCCRRVDAPCLTALNPRQALGVWFSIAPFTPRFWGEEHLSGHQPDTAFPVRCCCDVFRLAVLVRIKLWFRYRLTDSRPSDKVGGPGERDLGPRGNVLAPPQPREAECVACRSVRVGRTRPQSVHRAERFSARSPRRRETVRFLTEASCSRPCAQHRRACGRDAGDAVRADGTRGACAARRPGDLGLA